MAIGAKGGLGNSSPNYKQGLDIHPKIPVIKKLGIFIFQKRLKYINLNLLFQFFYYSVDLKIESKIKF